MLSFPVAIVPAARIHLWSVSSKMVITIDVLAETDWAVHPEAIWALNYTPQHLISGASDGHLRIFDPTALADPLHDIASNPLAITSLSSTSDGKYALSTSLDGKVVLVDVVNGVVVGKVETGREKAAEGEKGASLFPLMLPFLFLYRMSRAHAGGIELAGYAAAIHPQAACWAWSGRSSKLGIRQIPGALATENGESVTANGNGNENGDEAAGRGALAGEGKVVDTGKGKFGMDVKFVRLTVSIRVLQAHADANLN